MTTTEEQAARLAIADVRSFDDTTAGPRRRAALANHTRAWLDRAVAWGHGGHAHGRCRTRSGGQFGAGRPGAAQ
jgi:hypothetical protein